MNLDWKPDRQNLWHQLQNENLVGGEVPELGKLGSPWYVRLLVGFSGWLAAGFMLGFIATGFESVFRNEGVAAIVGTVMILLAYILLDKKGDQDFVGQFALALSFTGQVLTIYALFEIRVNSDTGNWLIFGLLQAALAWLMPNSIHRVWSAFAASMALSFALIHTDVYFIQAAIIMAAVAYVWLHELDWIEQHQRIKPVGYGLTLGLILQGSSGLFYHFLHEVMDYSSGFEESWLAPWMGEVVAGAVMLYVVWALLKRQHVPVPSRAANAALLGTLVLILASMKVYGITIGMMIILLGYANGNRILSGFGIASLLIYISSYYYLLHSTLLEKSKLLAIMGVLLLLASWLMRRWLPNPKEENNA